MDPVGARERPHRSLSAKFTRVKDLDGRPSGPMKLV